MLIMYYWEGSISLTRHPVQNCSSVSVVIRGMPHTAPLPRSRMVDTPLHNTEEAFLLTDKCVGIVPTRLSFSFSKICCSLVHYRQFSHPSTKQLQYNCVSLYFSLLRLCFERQWCADKSLGVTESIEFQPLALGMTLNIYLPCLILIVLICKETMAYFITQHQIWIIGDLRIICHPVQCCCNFYFAIFLSHNLNFHIFLAFSISRIISAM